MIFLERNSNVRTAKVYAAFSSEDCHPWRDEPYKDSDERNTWCYLVTEFITGETLLDLQTKEEEDEEKMLRPAVHRKIAAMFAEQFQQLRSVPPQSHYYGRINNRPFPRLGSLDIPKDPDSHKWGGPYEYDEFLETVMHTSMMALAIQNSDSGSFEPLKRHAFHQAKSVLGKSEPDYRVPVLQHGDLQAHNVMVKLLYDKKGHAFDVEDLVFIDWEYMAWVPPWFELGGLIRISIAGDRLAPSVVELALDQLKFNMAPAIFWGYGIHRHYFRYNHF
ncbi:unnamed protein product [Periconia digitata]|uniref:Aminoglycoside phosphotransferase domain-containing protein n=1 Tax=Periconia digitata TaxID=1303443 RepID=A0A9W4XH83_9PLEO|nr:unnamed protein product [Periconia digitata]